MKKALKMKRRNLVSFMLIIAMMLSMTTNVFASWISYNAGVVYLEETWIGSKQCINFYSNGQWIRNVAGENHTLWINSVPILYNLYDTRYWCFDENGNIYVINTLKELLLNEKGTMTFKKNTAIEGCTGFQRDSNKVGYLVYTESGITYKLSDVRNGIYNTVNKSSVSESVNSSITSIYPYVEKYGVYYTYHINENNHYTYYFANGVIRYMGTDSRECNIELATEVKDFTFDSRKGYIVYAYENGNIKANPLGNTSAAKRMKAGSNFWYFDGENRISSGYVNNNGTYKSFSYSSNNYNDRYEDDYDYDDYPCIKKSGNYFYFYTSSKKYHKYQLNSSTLYYKGTNSTSISTILDKNVKKVTFSPNGYIAYSVDDNYDRVYAYPVGKTSSSYKETVGKYFDHFDKYYDDYMSSGYYDQDDEFIDFDF